MLLTLHSRVMWGDFCNVMPWAFALKRQKQTPVMYNYGSSLPLNVSLAECEPQDFKRRCLQPALWDKLAPGEAANLMDGMLPLCLGPGHWGHSGWEPSYFFPPATKGWTTAMCNPKSEMRLSDHVLHWKKRVRREGLCLARCHYSSSQSLERHRLVLL